MANGWTPERRAKHSEAIRTWKPWEKTEGPTSVEGKATVSRNAWRGDPRGTIAAARRLQRLVSEDARFLALASRSNAEG